MPRFASASADGIVYHMIEYANGFNKTGILPFYR